MTQRRNRHGVIAGPLDPIETAMTLIAVNISLLVTGCPICYHTTTLTEGKIHLSGNVLKLT